MVTTLTAKPEADPPPALSEEKLASEKIMSELAVVYGSEEKEVSAGNVTGSRLLTSCAFAETNVTMVVAIGDRTIPRAIIVMAPPNAEDCF
jgi:hypothetical protein